MPRDWDSIQKAALAMAASTTKDEVTSLPPGYISGFYVTLKQDYTVTISAGTAYVGGRAVKMAEEHLLAKADWVVPRLDTPQHYYIYLAKTGNIYVDLTQPKFNSGYNYYEQPDYGWRAIGKLFVKSNNIIYCNWNPSNKGATVTVAPAGYTGEADYFCTGTADDILINAAILYVYTAYYGGTVQLLEGDFNLTNWVETRSDIKIIGNGPGTKINGATYGISSDATTTVHYHNIHIANIQLKTARIYCDYTDGIIIENIWSDVGTTRTVFLADCSDARVAKVIANGVDFTTVDSGSVIEARNLSNSSIVDCSISNITQTGTVTPIYIHTAGNVIVSRNTLHNISTSGAGSFAIGIWCHDFTYSLIESNRIEEVKNSTVATDVWALRVAGVGNKVSSNMCYNNGSDTGIANTNGNNFSDAGTDTQCYSNSWQSPVASEPSLGTPHPHIATIYNAETVDVGTYTIQAITTYGCPVGTKQVYVWGDFVGATVGRQVQIRDMSGNTYCGADSYTAGTTYSWFSGYVLLDSSGQFDVVVIGNTVTSFTLQISFYDS